MDNNFLSDMNKNEEENLQIFTRTIRAVTERILLLDITLGEDNDVFFKVLGSKDNIYTIHVWLDFYDIKYDCTCPDNKYRQLDCKHVLWLSLKNFYKSDPKEWTTDDINNFYSNWYNIYCYPAGRNTNCPICLEHIDYDKQNTVGCTNSCNNSVHTLCWNRYYTIAKTSKCIICRKFTMPRI